MTTEPKAEGWACARDSVTRAKGSTTKKSKSDQKMKRRDRERSKKGARKARAVLATWIRTAAAALRVGRRGSVSVGLGSAGAASKDSLQAASPWSEASGSEGNKPPASKSQSTADAHARTNK